VGTYEIVAVLRPDLDEEGLGSALDRIKQRVVEHGGNITSMDRWGKRKLAYPIQKHRDGYYALLVFTLDTNHITPLRQVLGLNEELLRFAFASHHAKPAAAAAPGTASHATPAATPASATPVSTAAPAPATPPASGAPESPATPPTEPPHV
jgi:small subunit ribosomal protein S6